jgi:hypothetical protein
VAAVSSRLSPTPLITIKKTQGNDGKVEAKIDSNRKVFQEEMSPIKKVHSEEKTETNPQKTEQNPEIKSIAVHEEVPKEYTAMNTIGGLRKRHWCRNLAAERRQKPMERTRIKCGSLKQLVAARRETTHRATVAWRKRNVFRKIMTQGNCAPRKELATAGRKMTRCTKVAQHKGRGFQGRSQEGPSVEKG